MQYRNVSEAKFTDRPNRFTARVCLNGREETVHIKNTGRCRELLVPGCRVWLTESGNSNRKTRFDLIAVEKVRPGKQPLLVNLDSQAPNDVAEEWLRRGLLFSEDALLRRETVHGDSRFDFYIENGSRRAFLEVKGVTLEENGTAAFPDAPTERGVKHLNGLVRAVEEGYEAYLVFVVQMKEMYRVVPNPADTAFTAALKNARDAGVHLLAIDCTVRPDSISPDIRLPVVL